MFWIFVGAAGVTGALYFLLNLFWPGWYLDIMYSRSGMRVGNAMMEYISKNKMLIDIFEDTVSLTPSKTFVIYNDEKYTYTFVDKKANQVARACLEIGIVPGSTVAVMIHNSPAFIWTYLGRCYIVLY